MLSLSWIWAKWGSGGLSSIHSAWAGMAESPGVPPEQGLANLHVALKYAAQRPRGRIFGNSSTAFMRAIRFKKLPSATSELKVGKLGLSGAF